MPDPSTLPPWRPLLRAAREREGRSPMSRWLQLATVAADGTPRVRTLVFRGWAEGACLDLLTDARSAKAVELGVKGAVELGAEGAVELGREGVVELGQQGAVKPGAVELCWLLPRARCQFRLRGRRLPLPQELEERERQRHWRQLTPQGRALWGWPHPGEPLDATASFPRELADGEPVPETFLLLRLELTLVELLELGPHPHQRRRWRAETGWREEPLNP